MIFLDMDGVLANWTGSVCRLFDRDPEQVMRDWPEGEAKLNKVLGVSGNELWRRLDAAGQGFWDGLEPYPWANELVELCRGMGEVVILTSPSYDPGCLAGKLSWLQDFFHDRKFRDYIITNKKSLLARDNSLLIDDNDGHCEKFEKAGGQAIVFPQPWNSAREDTLGVELVFQDIHDWHTSMTGEVYDIVGEE